MEAFYLTQILTTNIKIYYIILFLFPPQFLNG